MQTENYDRVKYPPNKFFPGKGFCHLQFAALCITFSDLLAFRLGTNIKILPRTENDLVAAGTY